MAYKTLRNKAMRRTVRLITATYHGAEWAAPDGHFATSAAIYEGYRPLRDQYAPEEIPVMDSILDRPADYEPLIMADTDGADMVLTSAGHTARVNGDYFNLMVALWPEAGISIAGHHDPVRFKQNGELVAVIMPLRP